MNHQNQADDDLWKPPRTAYHDDDGEYARGTPQELVNQVKALKAELAEMTTFAADVLELIRTGWGNHPVGQAILARIDSMLSCQKANR